MYNLLQLHTQEKEGNNRIIFDSLMVLLFICNYRAIFDTVNEIKRFPSLYRFRL